MLCQWCLSVSPIGEPIATVYQKDAGASEEILSFVNSSTEILINGTQFGIYGFQ